MTKRSTGHVDRIAVMSNGEVQQIGSPREIYNNPANHFVANFIGEANILEVMDTPEKGKKANSRLIRSKLAL